MNVIKFLLLPLSLLYGIGILLRNLLFDVGIFPAREFTISTIAIGNLTVGGTGKSPMAEYLVRLIKEKYLLAILSRGYKRHTSGFILADNTSTTSQIGDEPLQFKKKFPDTIVAVDESRKRGIEKLLVQFPDLKVILLDDAFQHRWVKASLTILLTEYSHPFYDDFLLPAGTLREWKSAKKRADVIVVTKCPKTISPVEKRIIVKNIEPLPHQQVFFSLIKYGNAVPMFKSPTLNSFIDTHIILLTGISNPEPLKVYLKQQALEVIEHSYPDHHEFTLVEVNKASEAYHQISSSEKIIITTEKDAMRLDKLGLTEILEKLPMYYIPIETSFDETEKEGFDNLINQYVIRTNQKYGRLH